LIALLNSLGKENDEDIVENDLNGGRGKKKGGRKRGK
jgi:hypothetical protein